ncbi:LssY C-terminal domain-containing protein [Azospirillum sp. sgz301742]
MRRAIPVLAAGQRRVWEWAASRDTWIARPVRAILDPSRPEGKALALAAGILVAASWLFLGILEDVVSRDPLVRADVGVYRLLQGLRTPWVDSVMVAITEFGDTAVTVPVTLAVALYLAVRRRWKTLGYWLAAVGGAAAINTAIKGALHRARPGALGYPGWSEFSFPSGHSTTNAVMYGFLAFLVVRQLDPAWWPAAVLAWAGVVVPIAFSCLYLGAHWFSDVMGGLAFGMAWVAVLSIAHLHHRHRGRVGGLFAVACVTLVVAGGANVYRKHAAEVQRYAAREPASTVLAGDWWAQGWRRLPARRVDLVGEEEEPMTVQWAGPIEALKAALEDRGWREPDGWTAPNTLAWLTADADTMMLPVLPYLDSGRLPALTLIHPAEAGPAAARWVVRLWATGFELRNGGAAPLWVGSVVEERFTRPYSLFTLGRMQHDLDGPRNALASALGEDRLVGPAHPVAKYEWDRRVLLARAPSIRSNDAAP